MSLPVFVSRNGEIIPAAQAHVSVFSPAVSSAYGVYESLQVVNGTIFALQPHLDRLVHSASMLDLALPANPATLERWMTDALAANDAVDCVLRLFVVGSDHGGQSTVFIWPQPAPNYPQAFYEEGATAVTFEGERTLPTVKSLNSLVSFLARRHAQATGVHEGLLHHGGYLTEGSNSNLFVVLDGVVITPPAGQVLAGVARDTLLRLAEQNGIEIQQRPVALGSIGGWSECFITSTSRHVMPITVIDGRPVGSGKVGPTTRHLMTLFEEYFRQAVRQHGR